MPKFVQYVSKITVMGLFMLKESPSGYTPTKARGPVVPIVEYCAM